MSIKNIIAFFVISVFFFTNIFIANAIQIGNVMDFGYESGDSNIVLSWTNPPSPDFAGVLIVRSTSSISWQPIDGTVYTFGQSAGPNTNVIYYSTGEEYTDSPLTNGTNYYFKAFTFDYDAVYSSGSDELMASPMADGEAPSAPTNLTGDVLNGEINLSWTPSDSADTQKYKATCLPDEYTLPELSKETSENSVLLPNAVFDVEYTCSVQTIDYSNNYSDDSESIVLKETSDSGKNLFPPQTLTGEILNNDAYLNWMQNSVKSAVGFNVYGRCSDETIFNKINNQVVLNTKFTVDNLYYNYICDFYITSIDNNLNESEASNTITLETGDKTYDSNLNLNVITGDGQAYISWNDGTSNSNGNENTSSSNKNIYLDGNLIGNESSPIALTGLNNSSSHKVQIGDNSSSSISFTPPSSNEYDGSGTFNSKIKNINLSLNGDGKPQISWTLDCPSCDGFAGFKIYKGTDSNNLNLINRGNLLINKSPYTDEDTASGNKYYYKFEAFDLNGKLVDSNFNILNITSKDATNAGYFNDVQPGHTFFNYIESLRTRSIVSGYDGHIFKPYQAITRVEALKMIMRSSNIIPNDSFTFHTYRDLPTNMWFYDYVQTGSLEGIVRGYDDGLFRPNQNVSRVEFLKMVMESGDIEITNATSSKFQDMAVDFWGTDYANIGLTKNIISGYSDGTFRPNQPITRAEAAKIVSYLLK